MNILFTNCCADKLLWRQGAAHFHTKNIRFSSNSHFPELPSNRGFIKNAAANHVCNLQPGVARSFSGYKDFVDIVVGIMLESNKNKQAYEPSHGYILLKIKRPYSWVKYAVKSQQKEWTNSSNEVKNCEAIVFHILTSIRHIEASYISRRPNVAFGIYRKCVGRLSLSPTCSDQFAKFTTNPTAGLVSWLLVDTNIFLLLFKVFVKRLL